MNTSVMQHSSPVINILVLYEVSQKNLNFLQVFFTSFSGAFISGLNLLSCYGDGSVDVGAQIHLHDNWVGLSWTIHYIPRYTVRNKNFVMTQHCMLRFKADSVQFDLFVIKNVYFKWQKNIHISMIFIWIVQKSMSSATPTVVSTGSDTLCKFLQG